MVKFRLLTALILTIGAPLALANDTFPIHLVNHSQLKSDDGDSPPIYIFIKAKQPDNRHKPCVMKLTSRKNGALAQCKTVKPDTKLKPFNFTLSELPKVSDSNSNHAHQLYLPKAISGRIYLSVGSPMEMIVKHDNKGNLTIPDPDGFKTRDPNYYKLYDKVEFSYNDLGTWMNPTAVDFFSLPLGIHQPSADNRQKAGFTTSSRQAILKHVRQTIQNKANRQPPTKQIWQRLLLTYQGATDKHGQQTTVLRLMAPGKAMTHTNPLSQNSPFDPHYLANDKLGFNYIDALWQYYNQKGQTVVIDTSELKGNPDAPQLDDYQFIGHVNNKGQFVFSNGNPEHTVTLDKPATKAFFAGATGVFNASNNTPKAIIVRQLTSAFEVGLLPADNGTVLDHDYFLKMKDDFYHDNDYLKTGNTGPWYDLYSRALHSVSGLDKEPIYTFAYDDALGQDGTLHDSNADNIGTATITLGNLKGTFIPRPEKEQHNYHITVYLGQNQSGDYYPATIAGHSLKPGKALDIKTIRTPIHMQLNHKTYKIHLKHPMIKPYRPITDGIILKQDNQDKDHYIIKLPGPPSES